MSNSKVKITDRILAVLLSVILLLGFMPLTVFAAPEDDVQQIFTVTVRDKEGNLIEKSTVTYDITVNGEIEGSGSAVTNSDGVAEITGLSDYAELINSGTASVGLNVKAKRDGYAEGNGQQMLTSLSGNINVILTNITPRDNSTATVVVTKSGNQKGTVSIDGDENSLSRQVGIGSTIRIEATPDEGQYIASVKINDELQAVKTPESSFVLDYKVEVNEVRVDVQFVDNYTVELIAGEGGTVTANGTSSANGTKLLNVELGERLSINAVPAAGYRVESATINGKKQTFTSSGFSATYNKLTADKVSEGRIVVEVTFARVYTVEVSYNSQQGSVASAPQFTTVKDDDTSNVIGTVKMEEAEDVLLTIEPAENYRVAAITVNGETETFEDNDVSFTGDNAYVLPKGVDYEVQVTFAFSRFDVTVSGVENAEVTLNDQSMANNGSIQVDYNGGATLEIDPADGYYIASLKVDGVSRVIENPSDPYSERINSIVENVEIEMVIAATEVLEIADYPFNTQDALRIDGNTFVFKSDTDVVFTAGEEYDQVYVYTDKSIFPIISGEDKTVTISNEANVTLVNFIKSSDGRYSCYTVYGISPQQPLKIVYDESKPLTTLSVGEESINGFYNDDVSVSVNVTDIINPKNENQRVKYSGIQNVQYMISDGINISEWVPIYTHSDTSGIAADFSGYIPVDASVYNTSNVVVTVKATDRAGLEAEIKTISLNINSIAPEISVSMSGTCEECEADPSVYYCDSRTATITITDRADTFNEDSAKNIVKVSATNSEGEKVAENVEISTWESVGDTHTATVTFFGDANYTWEIQNYTNKAGLTNDGVTQSGVNVFEFTVDGHAPTGEISISETNTWEELLETLTFGIFKKTDITVTATAEDAITNVESITYYRSNSETALTLEQLEAVDAEFTAAPITVTEDATFVVYAKLTDSVGNISYISTDGLIVDKSLSNIVLTPDQPNDFGLYNGDVNIDVAVTDNGSGIQRVEYVIYHDGVENKKETLYRTNVGRESEYNGNITINGEEHNLDNVSVTVFVTDQAGNESKDSVNLKINTSKPEVNIEFYDEYNENNYRREGYFSSRTAEITITDRASAFDPQAATNGLIVYANGEENNAIVTISDWTSVGDEHTATVEFKEDAEYTWSYSYTNRAGNSSEIKGERSADNSPKKPAELRPYAFTIDNSAPFGEIIIEDNAWAEPLEILTFGLYSKVPLEVSASADDVTSPLILEYFKTDRTEALTPEELEREQFTSIQLNEETKSVSALKFLTVPEEERKSERFAVYLKISDYAGNYVYINSDGHIVDKTLAQITLTPDKPNANNIYNKDVNVKVNVTDNGISSGINQVRYWVELLDTNGVSWKVTQDDVIYTYAVENPSYEELVTKWDGNIVVDSELNNWSKVRVTVEVYDNADNITTDSCELDIDITAPEIDITYDNNADNGGNGYFNKERTAVVVITERADHFDSNAATKGISITATDVQGKTVDASYEISSWKPAQTGVEPDAATHTATIKFKGDANYTFDISYTDRADNANSGVNINNSVAPYKFTVDKTAPTGTISAVSSEGRSETWDKLIDTVNFGFWSNNKISISSTSKDLTSPVASVEYYKASSQSTAKFTSALSVDELKKITAWEPFSAFDVVANEQFTVYLRIKDMAGNTTYISTNGMIVDNTAPREEVAAPDINMTPQQAASGIYSGDVKVSISVDDPLLGGTYSGLKTVSYRVLNMGQVTQSGTLYSFDNASPVQADLLKTWTGAITVDSQLNNSNDVVIEVFAEDNSLNTSTNSIAIKIDTTAPVINVSYNNNDATGTIFNADRVATIVITERNFSPDEVNAVITNSDGAAPSLSAWSVSGGSGNGDDTRWTATVTYSADGDYTFDIGCTDLAGHSAGEPNYGTSVAPTEFTMDQTLPVINVSYNNESANNYFNADRTATITINEHNFNSEAVNISISATENGSAVTAPPVSSWSSNGDVHTATVVYCENAKYTFNISYTDEASNAAEAFSEHVFYVDKKEPTLIISGVENQSANKGEVAPVIEYSDNNLDAESVKITLSGVTRGENLELIGDYEDIENGRIFTFENFAEEKEIDDIYTMTVFLQDLAGNKSEETIEFSVNRFGSTYDMSEDTSKLNGSFVTAPNDVVITEVNANELSEITITLFKNNETIVLKEGDGYKIDVEGGNGQWYKYTYTIFKENFADDGVYRITVHSEDKAGNVAENTLDTKSMEIGFGVDKTAPNIVVANTENGKTYAKESHNVILDADDNLKLESVTVFLDGKEHKTWSKEEVESIIAENGEFNFDISGDSTKAHSIKIVCVDSAGNETVEEVTDFFVTTNLFVRFYNNKVLFFGSIAGVIAVLGLIIFLIVFKRRKRENNR